MSSRRSIHTVDFTATNYADPVIDAYKKDVDRTLLRENLKLTPDERFQKFEQFMAFVREVRSAGQKHRAEAKR